MFLLISGFHIINCNSSELRRNQISSVKDYVSLSDYSNLNQDSTRGKNVASTAITTTSATVIFNTNIQPQVQ